MSCYFEQYSIIALVQKICNCGEIQNIILTLHKPLNVSYIDMKFGM